MRTTPPAAVWALSFLLFAFTSSQLQGVNGNSAGTEISTDSLFQKAVQLKTGQKFNSAAELFQTVSQEYKKQQNWEQYIASQRHLAYCFWVTHRGDQALDLCRRTLEEGARWLGPGDIQIAKVYTVMGNVHADRRTKQDFDKCVAYYEKALEITRKYYGDGHPALADAYERLGIARYLIDDFTGAIPFYEKALAFLEAPAAENATAYSKIYNNLGLIYFGMGHFPKAMDNFKKAKHIVQEIQGQEDMKVVKFLINIAQVQVQMGDFAEALITLEEASALEAKVGEPGNKMKAYLLGSIGDCYLAKEDFQKAAGYFQQCLAYWNPNNRDDANGLILELLRTGECHLKLQQTSLAYGYFQRAYATLDAYYDKDNFNWVDVLVGLGLACEQKGGLRLAEQYFQRALSIAHQKVGANHPDAGKIQMELARLYFKEDKLAKALDKTKEGAAAFLLSAGPSSGFPAAEQISNLPDYIALLELTGRISARQYEFSKDTAGLHRAMNAYYKGMAYSDSLKIRLQSGPALQKAQRQVYSLAEQALDCLYRLWQITGEEHLVHDAFFFFEKSKNARLRSSAREWLARQYAGVPGELVERELALKTELAYYQDLRKNQKLSSSSGADFRADVWQERFFEAKKELDQLLKQMEAHYPAYYNLKYDLKVASLAETQRFVQLEGAELITYFWGEKSAYAIDVTPGRLRWIKMDGLDSIENELALFHQAIGQGPGQWQTDESILSSYGSFCQSARSLYNRLVQPVIDEQGQGRLILAPDGPLGRLPFQALLVADPGREAGTQMDYRKLPYLIRERPVQYEYAAGLLLQEDRRGKGKGYIGFSPTYSGKADIASLTRGDRIRMEEQYPSYLSRDAWGQLAYNQEEVNETTALLGGKKITGSAATEYAFKEVAAEAAILHLATHGFVHDTEPDYSALAFAQDPQRPEDGQLHAYELYNLPLQAGLAVLSACNTGAGMLQPGEGIMSLSRAFQYAGCPSVVMSLWPANDVAAKEVIVGFFRQLQQGVPKSEALQRASLDFLSNVKDDKLAHPFYWANFVVIGKDDPIQIEHPVAWFQPWMAWVAGLFGLFVIGLFFWRHKISE